jgi:hypothetical protein
MFQITYRINSSQPHVTNHLPRYIPKGSHTVKHKDSTTIFGSYLYGHAYHESYAFPTGMRLAKINAVSDM